MTSPTLGSEALTVIELGPHDDRASLSYRLDTVADGRVALLLPWDVDLLSRALDFDLLRREVHRRQLEVAVVSPDPERRQLARGCGFAAFPTVAAAGAAVPWNGRAPKPVAAPPKPWWAPHIDLQRRRRRPQPTWLRGIGQGIRLGVFVVAIFVLAATAYAIVPRAEVTVVPAGTTVSTTVTVAIDPDIEAPRMLDGTDGSTSLTTGGVTGIIPSRRVGLEIEGTAEVEATGTGTVTAGRATGEVLFTSVLAQDYVVPAGTIVRTSSTSYPIRFRTTTAVVVPADGQGTASIEALDERTGNVGAFQINRVEGIVASAVRVINPAPTKGAEPEEVSVVTQADYDRVRQRLTQELLNEVHYDLHSLLEIDEFLPRQSLRVESVPKKVYSRFVGEQAETLSLNLRLLVSGQAVGARRVEEIAYQSLVRKLPAGHQLIDADFEIGAITVDEDAPGWFTVSVTGHGYAAAAIDPDEIVSTIRGRRVPEAQAALLTEFPLAEPPQLAIWPEWPAALRWLERAPLLTIRTQVEVKPLSSAARADS